MKFTVKTNIVPNSINESTAAHRERVIKLINEKASERVLECVL